MRPFWRKFSKNLMRSGLLDLCSGGSGPLTGIQGKFDASGRDFRAVITDRFPNLEKMVDLLHNFEIP